MTLLDPFLNGKASLEPLSKTVPSAPPFLNK
jgi:hypothetical protein